MNHRTVFYRSCRPTLPGLRVDNRNPNILMAVHLASILDGHMASS
jgi:hypothetical protein